MPGSRPSSRSSQPPTSRRITLRSIFWVVVGMLSYGSIGWLMLQDDRHSYTSIMATHQKRQHFNQRIMEKKAAPEQQRQEYEQKRREEKQSKIRQRRVKTRRTDDDGTFFDWSFWGLCFCFALMAYVRIRAEPSRRRDLRRRRTLLLRMQDETNVVQTLRRLNQSREARGESPITLDAYRALRMALLQDRTLLRGLAGHPVPPPSRGATPEQLECCQQHVILEEDENEGGCCICLNSYEINDHVRILPCSHSYHKDCIDHWLQQSILCPICKSSLHDTTERAQ